MSYYSSFVNSFLQILPFSSWFKNKRKLVSLIEKTTSGMLRRQGSTKGGPSNLFIGTRPDYAYDIDTCQTIYLAEKLGDRSYRITAFYTKEFRPYWLEKKLRMIMLRILVAEQQIPVLNEIFDREGGWKIIGSIDCQKDRSYAVNQFHQDSLLSAFIHNIHEPIFTNDMSPNL